MLGIGGFIFRQRHLCFRRCSSIEMSSSESKRHSDSVSEDSISFSVDPSDSSKWLSSLSLRNSPYARRVMRRVDPVLLAAMLELYILYIPSLIFSTNHPVYWNQLSCTSRYIIFLVFRIWQLSNIRVQRWLKNYLEWLFYSVTGVCFLLWLRYFLKIRQKTLGVLNFCNRMAPCLMVTLCNLNIGLNTILRQNAILIIKVRTPHCQSCFFIFISAPIFPNIIIKNIWYFLLVWNHQNEPAQGIHLSPYFCWNITIKVDSCHMPTKW